MPFRVPEKPGGVFTVRPVRFWSPSLRSTTTLKGEWAPAASLAEPVWNVGLKGRGPLGHADPLGPPLMVIKLVAWRVLSSESQGTNSLSTGKVPHLSGGARRPRSDPKKWRVAS